MAARRPHTQLYCHLVWATWDRLPLISPEIELRLHGALRTKAEELGCRDLVVNGTEDHIHLLCRFPPVLSLSELVQQLKGASSHSVNHCLDSTEEFRWQGGYSAVTVDRASLEPVRRYVLGQKQHHQEARIWPEWEQIYSEE